MELWIPSSHLINNWFIYSNFIDFQKEARNQNHSGNIKKEHRAVLCIDEVRAKFMECGFGLTRKEESTFVFNGEFWGIISSEQIKHFLGEAAAKMGISPLDARSSAYKDLLFCQFVSDSFLNVIESDEDSIKINLQNGTFEISENSQQLREFKAEDFLTYQLGFSYQPEAKAPKFLKYLDQVLPDKSLQMIVAEFFGYVFTRKLRLEKALLLYGQGQNGKSVLFHIIHALLGRENMRSFSLTDLLQEHNRALISNCLLNYGTEINASTTRDIFKNLVSGEPIMARMKYGNSFIMDSYGKLCFNCNELPSDIEQNDAYYRRLLIIPFDVKISNEAIDPQLAQKIINSELSGVFNWVLEGLRRIIQHKIFTHSERMEEMLRQYRKESDNVALFIEDNSSIQPEYAIDGLLKDVHSNYKSYCQDCGYRALGRNNFTKRMEALGFEKSHGRLGTVLEKL